MVSTIPYRAWILSCCCVFFLCLTGALSADPVVTKYFIPYAWPEITWSDAKTGFIASSDATVWRSGDEGQTWSQMPFQHGNRSFGVARMYRNEQNNNQIFFLMQLVPGDVSSFGFITTNGAATTPKFLVLPVRTSEAVWHPRQVNSFLINQRDDFGNILAVYVTRDLGNTWTQVFSTTDVDLAWIDVFWGNINETSPVNTLYYRDSEAFSYASGDNFTTHTEILKNSFGAIFLNPYVYVGQARNGIPSLQVAKQPSAYTDSKSYHEAIFPFGDRFPSLAYTVFEANTGAARVGISHSLEKGSSWGNVYSSDDSGWVFSTTLQYVNQPYGLFDFDEVYGLLGAYLANVMKNPDSGDRSVRTMLTHNSGATWQYLQAPARDANNVPIVCEISNGCSLHLNGISSYVLKGVAPFYSSDNAVGIIIATGNTGTSLNTDVFNTYLSRDGGITWTELAQGPYIYEIGDHGGVLVMAKGRGASTDTIMYSLDEGATWNKYQLDYSVVVDNILVEPSGTSNKFVLFGAASNSQGEVVVGIDFSSLHETTCTDADYEDWVTPYQRSDGQNCVLGVKTTYSRRIQTSKCFNPRDRDIVKSVEACKCTLVDDYECDYGYVRDPIASGLVCAKQLTIQDPPPNCEAGTSYYVPNTYRRILGDGCKYEDSSLPVEKGQIKTCPGPTNNTPGTSTIAEWAVAIFLILLALGLAGGFFYLYRNDQARAKLLSMVGRGGESARYSRLGGVRPQSLADEEFGADTGLDDDEEPDAPVLQDHEIKASFNDK